MENEHRLTPTTGSRKLQAVSVVLRYRERWGRSPSYRVIGEVMETDRSTARGAVQRAIRDGLLFRLPGNGGLIGGPALRPTAQEVDAMIARLREAGLVVVPVPIDPDGRTLCSLPLRSELEHIAPGEGDSED